MQEAQLAIPYLYEQMGDQRSARQAFQTALERFDGLEQYLLEVEPSTTHPADVLQKLSVCDLFGQVSAAACLHGLKVWFSM